MNVYFTVNKEFCYGYIECDPTTTSKNDILNTLKQQNMIPDDNRVLWTLVKNN